MTAPLDLTIPKDSERYQEVLKGLRQVHEAIDQGALIFPRERAIEKARKEKFYELAHALLGEVYFAEKC